MSILSKEQQEWHNQEVERVGKAMAQAGFPCRHYTSGDYMNSTTKGYVEVPGVGRCSIVENNWYRTQALVPLSCGVFVNNWGFVTEEADAAIRAGQKKIPYNLGQAL